MGRVSGIDAALPIAIGKGSPPRSGRVQWTTPKSARLLGFVLLHRSYLLIPFSSGWNPSFLARLWKTSFYSRLKYGNGDLPNPEFRSF